MPRQLPGQCPVCGERMNVTELHCPRCDVTIRGNFELCSFCSLPPDMKEFVEIFLKCRGNIKEVERELGISYPTVRNRLEKVIALLGYNVDETDWEEVAEERRNILSRLRAGEISSDEAVKLLKQLK